MARNVPAPTGAVAAGIMLRDKGDILDMAAAAGGPPRQGMRGFDPDYVDIVDYIVRITHRIWEEKAVGLIYDTYGHNIAMWTTDGLIKGRETIVQNTLRALAANPVCRIYVDEVVWTGNDADGFHTSMRYVSVCQNIGHTGFGPPTGRQFRSWGVANCFVRENRIIEEWTARDGLSMVRQLGFDPFEAAARAARADAARGKPAVNGQDERIIGQMVSAAYPPKTGDHFDVDDFLRRGTHEIWNRRLLDQVNDFYAPHVRCHAPSAKELYGTGDLKLHILGLLGAFPDATIVVDHLYWNEMRDGTVVTAMRWTLFGTHDGPGAYGPPSGRQVRLMGITQHYIRDGKIVEEWTIYDEFALLKQLVAV
jgi:predicted ester cyclase